MKTDTTDVDVAGTDTDLPVNTVFDVLLDQRRRYILRYLTRTVGSVSIDELADAIALWERAEAVDDVERIHSDLSHRHVPKLVDTKVARYDPTRDTVELRPEAASLEPYLRLSAVDDLSVT